GDSSQATSTKECQCSSPLHSPHWCPRHRLAFLSQNDVFVLRITDTPGVYPLRLASRAVALWAGRCCGKRMAAIPGDDGYRLLIDPTRKVAL
ncbi:MAG TPA: hypothetical protein VIU62_17080, partial [Chloroflexota bacterium]